MAYLNPRAGYAREGRDPAPAGEELFVNTVTGGDGNGGKSWDSAFATLAAAISRATDYGRINFVGLVREQIVAPVGVTGVTIRGAATRPIHDVGARWTDPASPVAGKALIEILEQGWRFENILFAPNATGAAIKAHREENATYPDSSHFEALGCRFAGGAIGIEDVGGNFGYLVKGCRFQSQTTAALKCSSTGIDVPTMGIIEDNEVHECANGFITSAKRMVIRRNVFLHVTTEKINTVYNSGQGEYNFVVDNYFDENEADIDIAHGYKGATTDVWRNFSKNTAAMTVGYAQA